MYVRYIPSNAIVTANSNSFTYGLSKRSFGISYFPLLILVLFYFIQWLNTVSHSQPLSLTMESTLFFHTQIYIIISSFLMIFLFLASEGRFILESSIFFLHISFSKNCYDVRTYVRTFLFYQHPYARKHAYRTYIFVSISKI